MKKLCPANCRCIIVEEIGTLAPEGQTAMRQDQGNLIVAPLTTIQRKIMGIDFIGSLVICDVSKDRTPEAQKEVTRLLRTRHKLQPWDDNDFTVRTQTEFASAARSTSSITTMLLGIIGVAMGLVSSNIISAFTGWPVLGSPGSVGLAFLFSAAVGNFVGYSPARKASGINPIKALRYE